MDVVQTAADRSSFDEPEGRDRQVHTTDGTACTSDSRGCTVPPRTRRGVSHAPSSRDNAAASIFTLAVWTYLDTAMGSTSFPVRWVMISAVCVLE